MDGKTPSTTASKARHPSLLFPKQKELNEIVRQYVAALINYHHITPFKYESEETLEQFGDMSAKELKKMLRRNKLKKHKAEKFAISDELRASLASRPTIEAGELAKLAKQARLAIEQAEQLAGKRVVYCCSNLRVEDNIDYECECGTRQRYRIVNEL
jgi:hypothetical protein